MLAMFMLWLHAIVVVAGADGVSVGQLGNLEVISVAADGAPTSQGQWQAIIRNKDISLLVESPDVVAQAISKENRMMRKNIIKSAPVGSLNLEAVVRKEIDTQEHPLDVGGFAEPVSQVATNTDYDTHAVAMPASLLVRAAAPSSFLAAPAGSIQNLFIPAIHKCNENLKQEFLKKFPGQGTRSTKQTNLEKLLRIVHDVNAELGMPTILADGSVLGFYRNCDVIPTDADGDTAVFGHWLQGKRSIENLAATYAARSITLQSDMCPHGPLYTGCELRAVHDNLGYVDVFVYATESACDEGPCSFFGPLYSGGRVAPTFHKMASGKIHFEQADFLDMTFWIPTPTLDYLKLNYGKTWDDPGRWPSGGVYKAVDFSKNATPVLDTFGAMMPPPEYVRSLEQTGPMREQQLLTATPAQ